MKTGRDMSDILCCRSLVLLLLSLAVALGQVLRGVGVVCPQPLHEDKVVPHQEQHEGEPDDGAVWGVVRRLCMYVDVLQLVTELTTRI